jgi:hypothetical protein
MPAINQLSSASSISAGDQLPLYSSAQGDARKVSMTLLAEYLQSVSAIATPATDMHVVTQGTGFNYIIEANQNMEHWVLMQPTGTLAAGQVTLPVNTDLPDGVEVLFTSTQQITAFTVDGNGSTVNGAPGILAADDTFRLRFYKTFSAWYRIA